MTHARKVCEKTAPSPEVREEWERLLQLFVARFVPNLRAQARGVPVGEGTVRPRVTDDRPIGRSVA
jgi:hypothetical protein